MVTSAISVLSFAIGILAVATCGGWFGTMVLVVAALINLPNLSSVTVFGIPVIVVALLLGFCFISGGGAIYTLFWVVVYLVLAAIGSNSSE